MSPGTRQRPEEPSSNLRVGWSYDVLVTLPTGEVISPNFWIFGTLKCDQIYGNIEEVIAEIKQIDAGEKKLDLSHWKIFREEFR